MNWEKIWRNTGKIPCYHGTNKFFKNPDFSKIGENTSDLNNVNLGFCLTDCKDYARDYANYSGGNIILKAHIKIKNPYFTNNFDLENICKDEESANNFKNQLIEEGYDSIVNDCGFATEFICFYPEQIKIIG